MSVADMSDDASSAWLSYTSGSSTRDPASKRSSWATTKFTVNGGQQEIPRLPIRSLANSALQPSLPSEHSRLSTHSPPVELKPSLFEPDKSVSVPAILDTSLILHNGGGRVPAVYLFAPPTVTTPPPHPLTWESPYEDYITEMSNSTDHTPNMRDLVTRLGSDEDPVRKMAVFKLQSLINDPAFAEVFIQEGGLARLRWLILQGSGNTLAYALASFARLLELDLSENRGWEAVDREVVEKVRIGGTAEKRCNILMSAGG